MATKSQLILIIITFQLTSQSTSNVLGSELLPSGQVLELDGSSKSFLQLPTWFVGLNGSLSLELRTLSTDALILYEDDGGLSSSYIQVKLVDGHIQLAFQIGGHAPSAMIIGSQNLADGEWHYLEIIRNHEETSLKVDAELQSLVVRGQEPHFGMHASNLALFLGGLPHEQFEKRLQNLSLPWTFFEPHYRGSIRNVMYASDSRGVPSVQEPVASAGLRFSQLNSCRNQDPCVNGGHCVPTDVGQFCNCRGLDFEGEVCQRAKVPPLVTFTGQEYIAFASKALAPIVSTTDELSLDFKTRHPNQMLFFGGDGLVDGDHLLVTLREGGVHLSLRLGGATAVEKLIKPSKVRFDDGQWHKVVIRRKIREFAMTVDGVFTARASLTGPFSKITVSISYLGGSDRLESSLPANSLAVQSNLIGCLRKIEYVADAIELDILRLSREQNGLFATSGVLLDSCHEAEAVDPITFTTMDAFLTLPTWRAPQSGSLGLKIRTNEANGVILFNMGAANGPEERPDFVAIELLDGHVFLLINLGSGPVKVKGSTKRVDDGHWHAIGLKRTGKSGRVTVDESAVDFIAPGTSSSLDLEGPLFLGAVGTTSLGKPHHGDLPPELWAGALGFGFVGCVRDLNIDNELMDIAEEARSQDSAGIRPACHVSSSGQCSTTENSCLNGGHCSEGWHRTDCRCESTGFVGPNCAKEAATVHLNGVQSIVINLDKPSKTQAEDILIRFRTSRPSGLILVTMSKEKSMSHLVMSLDGGRLKVSLNMGEGNKVVHAGRDLNDDLYHAIKIERRGPSLELKLDGVTSMAEITGQLITLQIDSILVGALDRDWIKKVSSSLYHSTRDIPNFVGMMQQLRINGRDYFESVRGGQFANLNLSATFAKVEKVLANPVTFKSRSTFLGLSQLKTYSRLDIYFEFRTLLAGGIILFNGGKSHDFVAIELVDGHLFFLINLGDGPRRLRSSSKSLLNDNKWHSVTISRHSVHVFTMMVDEQLSSLTISGSNIHLDLDSLLFVGGVLRTMFETLPKFVSSSHGFEGCLASFEVNGEAINLISDKSVIIPSTLVESGCPSSTSSTRKCSYSSASSSSSTVNCDYCDPSSQLASVNCISADSTVTYRFSGHGGMITFKYPEDKRPDTKSDSLAIGFTTTIKNAVLLRIDSANSNDYLEVQIVDGSVLIVYNLGFEDHDVGELSVRVDDDLNHVIKFARNGPNSTLQLDNHNLISKFPSGKQLTIFNAHSRILIGGKHGSVNPVRIDKPFIGVLTALSVNGDKVLELASQLDPRITIEGDIELIASAATSTLTTISKSDSHNSKKNKTRRPSSGSTGHRVQGHAKGSGQYEGDELILSGDGSGCWDDEDCSTLTDHNLNTDDLITPLILAAPPTKAPKATTSWPKPQKPNICDGDDDDCVIDGSGDDSIGSKSTTTTPHSNFVWPSPPSTSAYPWQTRITTSSSTTPRYEDNSQLYTFKPIPPPQTYERPNYNSNPVVNYPKPRQPIIPPRPTGPPVIVDVPRPNTPSVYNKDSKPKSSFETTYSKASADRTATIIGLIAVIIIIVVIMAPVILYLKVRYARLANPVVKEFRFNPVSGTPPVYGQGTAINGGGNAINGMSTMNGHNQQSAISSANCRQPPSILVNKKDHTEWYV